MCGLGVPVGCRMKHAKGMFKRWHLGLANGLGKLRRRSSTPAVVPGAAPALAKAGVGGYMHIIYKYISYIFIYHIYIYHIYIYIHHIYIYIYIIYIYVSIYIYICMSILYI